MRRSCDRVDRGGIGSLLLLHPSVAIAHVLEATIRLVALLRSGDHRTQLLCVLVVDACLSALRPILRFLQYLGKVIEAEIGAEVVLTVVSNPTSLLLLLLEGVVF
jgi:hypothetical protein